MSMEFLMSEQKEISDAWDAGMNAALSLKVGDVYGGAWGAFSAWIKTQEKPFNERLIRSSFTSGFLAMGPKQVWTALNTGVITSIEWK